MSQTDEEGSGHAIVHLPLNKTYLPSSFKVFVKSNGVVAIEAAHYTVADTKDGMSYKTLPYYGRTHSGIKIWPVDIDSQTSDTAPKLMYSFYTFSDLVGVSLQIYLGGSRNHDGSRLLKLHMQLMMRTLSLYSPSLIQHWGLTLMPGRTRLLQVVRIKLSLSTILLIRARIH